MTTIFIMSSPPEAPTWHKCGADIAIFERTRHQLFFSPRQQITVRRNLYSAVAGFQKWHFSSSALPLLCCREVGVRVLASSISTALPSWRQLIMVQTTSVTRNAMEMKRSNILGNWIVVLIGDDFTHLTFASLECN